VVTQGRSPIGPGRHDELICGGVESIMTALAGREPINLGSVENLLSPSIIHTVKAMSQRPAASSTQRHAAAPGAVTLRSDPPRHLPSSALRYRCVGEFTHAAIADLAHLEAGPTRAEIGAAVTRLMDARGRVPYHRAVWVGARSMTAVYFRRFRDPSLNLIDVELSITDESRLDLVWETASREIMVDEVKTGQPPPFGWRPTPQMVRYLKASSQRWGASFLGLRAVLLRAPALSTLFRSDGSESCTPHADGSEGYAQC
jgi:hypothetical protein